MDEWIYDLLLEERERDEERMVEAQERLDRERERLARILTEDSYDDQTDR